MSAVHSHLEVLFAIDLAVFMKHQAVITPILTDCGGQQIGSAMENYVAGFAATADGVVSAVGCAQRLQRAIPQGSLMSVGVHLGDAQGEALRTLIEIRKFSAPGAISMSQDIIDLGDGRLPNTLEPLDTPQGPTGFYTIVRTRSTEVTPRPIVVKTESTNSKMIYAQTTFQTTGKILNCNAAGADDETPEWRRIFTSNFGFLLSGLAVVMVIAMNVNSSKQLLERGKGIMLSSAVGRAIAEKASSKLDSVAVRPIDLAKKAAAQANQLSPQLLELAPEITREDVMGKARTGGVTPGSDAAPTQGSAVGADSSAGRRDIASPAPVAGGFEHSPIEDQLFANCRNDGGFCHTTGVVFVKEGVPASAVLFFNQGCELGVVKSCIQASILYQNGQGVERSESKAKALLLKACAKNDGPSCTEIGMAYLNGAGLPVSLPRAREAIDRACALGHGPACVLLGLGAQTPPEGVTVSKASSAESLGKGCSLLKLTTCSVPFSQKH